MMVELETWEKAEEPLSIIAADDPVTCSAYSMKQSLLNLPGWRRVINIARNKNSLARASNQTKIRQIRRSATNQSCYLSQETTNMPGSWTN